MKRYTSPVITDGRGLTGDVTGGGVGGCVVVIPVTIPGEVLGRIGTDGVEAAVLAVAGVPVVGTVTGVVVPTGGADVVTPSENVIGDGKCPNISHALILHEVCNILDMRIGPKSLPTTKVYARKKIVLTADIDSNYNRVLLVGWVDSFQRKDGYCLYVFEELFPFFVVHDDEWCLVDVVHGYWLFWLLFTLLLHYDDYLLSIASNGDLSQRLRNFREIDRDRWFLALFRWDLWKFDSLIFGIGRFRITCRLN